MGKLEELMDVREADEKAAKLAAEDALKAAAEKRRRRQRLRVRAEFNKLFKRLRTLVEGHWDRYGSWGWKFPYRDHDYWISFEHWKHERYGVDDYDMEGDHWVLKSHFNSLDHVVLGESGVDKDLTEKVLEGLKKLNERKF